MSASHQLRHACRASGRLNSLSETESAILNSAVAEEDEEGEESKSTAAGAKHMLGALAINLASLRSSPALQSLWRSPVLGVSAASLLCCGSQAVEFLQGSPASIGLVLKPGGLCSFLIGQFPSPCRE